MEKSITKMVIRKIGLLMVLIILICFFAYLIYGIAKDQVKSELTQNMTELSLTVESRIGNKLDKVTTISKSLSTQKIYEEKSFVKEYLNQFVNDGSFDEVMFLDKDGKGFKTVLRNL